MARVPDFASVRNLNRVWDPNLLEWVFEEQASLEADSVEVVLDSPVDQGAAGLDPWLVEVDNFPASQPVSIAAAVTVAQPTAANLNMTEASAASIKTAVETIDNFISGSRGLVTEDNSSAIAASLSVMDDWDESDRAKVNLIVGQAGIAAGTGLDGVTVPRVTLATNVALPAGTNAIGKLAANSGIDIGDVDVTSVSGNVTVVQATGTNLHTVIDSGTTVVTQGTATNLKVQAESYQGGTAVGAAAPLQVTLANGSVPSHAVTNAGTFVVQENGSALTSLQLIDDTVFTDDTSTHATGTTKGLGIMAVATPTDAAVDANDIGMVAMTTSRLLKVDASGVAVPITDNSGSLSVDWNGTQPVTGSGNATGALRVELANNGTGLVGLNAGSNAIGKLAANSGVDIGDVDVTTVGTITPGTATTSLGKAEDVAHGTGDVGVMALAVRKNTAASTSDADGDYQPLITNTTGHLWVDASGQTLTVGSHAVTNAGTFAVQAAGDVASGSSDSGNPVKVGHQARTTLPTAVTDGQRVNSVSDKFGRSVVVLGTVRDLRSSQTTTISASTGETTIVTAGAAGVFNDIISIIVSNTSAATNTRIDFRDDTAGTVIFSLQAPGNQTVGFTLPGTAWPQTTAAKNWTAQCGTSTTDIRIAVLFEKNK